MTMPTRIALLVRIGMRMLIGQDDVLIGILAGNRSK